MPVYNGNSKIKDLYYGGTKIKEAYYGSIKVYSSGPLYYCYWSELLGAYLYIQQKITSTGSKAFLSVGQNLTKANQASDLNYTYNTSVRSVSGDTIYIFYNMIGDVPFVHYQSNDLYT